MARPAGVTEILVTIGGSPVRLVTPKQWRRAVRQGEIERATPITREHRLTASSEEIGVAQMRADECPELQPLLDEYLGPVEVAPEPVPPPPPPAPPPPVTPPAPAGPVSVPTTATPATELHRARAEAKAQLAAVEQRLGKKPRPWGQSASKPPPVSEPETRPEIISVSVGGAQPRPAPAPPPPPIPATPPPITQDEQTSPGSGIGRWLLMFPGAVIGSFLAWLVLVWAAGFFTFDLFLLEAIAAYFLGFLAVSLYVHIGMAIAPRKNRLAKWLLITPYLPIWALMCVAIFISIGDGPIAPDEFSETILFSLDRLSPQWQLIWYGLGYAMGGFSIIKEPPSSYE